MDRPGPTLLQRPRQRAGSRRLQARNSEISIQIFTEHRVSVEVGVNMRNDDVCVCVSEGEGYARAHAPTAPKVCVCEYASQLKI